MYDDLYNFIDNLSYLDTVEDEDYQEDIIEIEQERLKQLKLDRLKLIKKAAKKIQKPSQKQPEAIVATPETAPKVAPVDVRKLTVKLAGASTDDLISTFIFSFLYNLSRIKTKKTLTLKRPRPTTRRFPMYTYKDALEELQPKRKLLDENWNSKYNARMLYYSQRLTHKNSLHHLQHVGYYPFPLSPNGLIRAYTFASPDRLDRLDSTLLFLLAEEYSRTHLDGIFTKVNGRYLLSINAVRWLEKQFNGGDL